MTSKEGIFLGSPPCLADVTEAKEKIEILIARKILVYLTLKQYFGLMATKIVYFLEF